MVSCHSNDTEEFHWGYKTKYEFVLWYSKGYDYKSKIKGIEWRAHYNIIMQTLKTMKSLYNITLTDSAICITASNLACLFSQRHTRRSYLGEALLDTV